ncbi:MAG: response regulator [Anaerolineales bacterium]|nr:response regulator [Anaerolineales bacterium]
MIILIGVALLPMLVGVMLSYQRAQVSLVNLALSKVEQEAGLTTKDLATYLEQFSTDLLMLSNAPPLQGLLRAQSNSGLDPATGRSYEEWLDWLRQLFVTTAQSKKFYQQLRYLDETGQEIVRIEYRDGAVTVVGNRLGQAIDRFLLENRRDMAYFTEAQQLQTGEIAISPLILNPEDKAEPAPIIYLSTPIYERAGVFRGVVVSTVYAASFLNRLSVNRGHIYLADEAGFYLAHPDPARTFGTEQKTGYNVVVDFSDTYKILLSSGNSAYTALDQRRAEVVALHKFHFDPLQPERYWLLIRTLPEDEVLGPVKTLGALTGGVALLVTVVVALLAHRLAGNFTRPIIRLTHVAEQISQKDMPQLVESLGRVAAGEVTAHFDLSVEPVKVHSEDEVGQLEVAFNRMATSLREAHARLLKTQEQLRLQKEAAEAANRAKSTFLANMSHELRTPLNGIMGYAQILKQRHLDADLVKGLNIIQQSGEHLLTLINDILDLAKVEAGKVELNPAPLYLPAFLRDIADIIRARAKAKGLSLVYETLSPLPDTVLADEKRLRQVLLNLLGNAVKFTDSGTVTLRVSARPETGDERREPDDDQPAPQGGFALSGPPSPVTWFRFEVADTGPGIAPDQMERIFQPFEQAGEVSRQVEGTGLGLTISRQLVRLMGSELHVESPPSIPSRGEEREAKGGPGSAFWFEVALPVTEVTLAVDSRHTPPRLVAGYKGPQRKVLVVDDITSNREVLVDLLAPLGFEVVEAADGQEAVALAQQIQPDLILMDQRMPGLDGLAAARQMRQMPHLQRTPLISISASVTEADQTLSQEAGYDAFLPKPIYWPRLATLLEKYLNLEWEYEEQRRRGAEAQGGEEVGTPGESFTSAPLPPRSPAALIPPPPEELTALYEVARLGSIRRIRDKAAELEKLGEQFVPFARKLRELAQGYQDKAILALIEKYLDKEVE